MTTPQEDTSPQQLRRRFPRTSVLWSGALAGGTEPIDCAILNLSAGGAKLRMPGATACPSRVAIQSARFGELAARVVWRRDSLLGLAFVNGPAAVAETLGNLVAVEAVA